MSQLGFAIGAPLLQGFGRDGRVDVHQFVACLSACHSDSINHPKSKQIFTLMDADRKAQITVEDFVVAFQETGDADKLGVEEQQMIRRYIEENRAPAARGLRLADLEEFLQGR